MTLLWKQVLSISSPFVRSSLKSSDHKFLRFFSTTVPSNFGVSNSRILRFTSGFKANDTSLSLTSFDFQPLHRGFVTSSPVKELTVVHKFHTTTRNRRPATMPPLPLADALAKVDDLIKTNQVMIFSKTYCPFCKKVCFYL